MRILAIETATDVGAVALADGDRLLGEYRLNRRFSHSRNLAVLIQRLLADCEWTWTEIEGIAVSIGPGSYTGLRIGLSMAKGLAYARSLPLTGVNSLDALAYTVESERYLICPLIRFRRQEFYRAFYRHLADHFERIGDYKIRDLQHLCQEIQKPTLFVGDLSPEIREILSQRLQKKALFPSAVHRYSSAFAVALLGAQHFQAGQEENVDHLEPFYMRGFPPEKVGHRKEVTG